MDTQTTDSPQVRIRQVERRQRDQVDVTNTTSDDLAVAVLRIIIKQQADAPRLFVQPGGSLCRKRDAGQGPIETLDEKKLKAELGHAIIFIERKGPGVTVALDDAPAGLVNAILNADRWPDALREEFPKLEHALDAPYFTKDGVLIQTDGYNYETNTYLTLAEPLKNMPPVSERPTKKEVYDAGKLLTEDLLGGFTFTSPAGRAHAVAAMICGFVKPILRGLVPMTVIIAPRVGEGKSLLANTITRVINGRAAYNMSAKLDDTEVEKRITAIFRAALDHILLDNVPDDGRLESTALASVLTSEEWAGRRLGHTDIRTSPNKLTWYATGNKITLARDLERRSMPIIMDSKTERPQDRVFTRNIKTWVVEERGKLVHAVLTIIKYWFCEGQPRFTARQKGSYEEYMAVVGGILDAAGSAKVSGRRWKAQTSSPRRVSRTTPTRVCAVSSSRGKRDSGIRPPKSPVSWSTHRRAS